jgi:diacylglycerol kinase
VRSVTHALAGLKTLLIDEHNARVHLAATMLVVILGLVLDIDASDWLILIVVIALVWITEALNTALENLADHVSPDHNVLIGKCKDVAAAAVLLAAICAVLCGAIIFVPFLL